MHQLMLPWTKRLTSVDLDDHARYLHEHELSARPPNTDVTTALLETQESLDDLLQIHEYERRRLGQELHDSTGQLVISLMLSLARLRRIEEVRGDGGLIDDIQEIVGQIDKEIRCLAFMNCPAELADRSLSGSVESLAVGFGKRTGLQISFRCRGGSISAAEADSLALLRVTQEALVNVHRHSHAKSAKVELNQRADKLELRISDDGIGMSAGISADDSHGIGVQGMRHRIEARGGKFEIRSLKRGTMVCATIPIAA